MLRTIRLFALNAVLAASVVALYLLLAPASIGGGLKAATVSGISMNPLLHAGDLAVVRQQDSYHIGDIVLYRANIGTAVLHRIIGEKDGRYTLKGDNNSFEDASHPDDSQVIGKYSFAVPAGGKVIGQLRSPYLLVAFLAGTIFFVFSNTDLANAKRKASSMTISTNPLPRFEFVRTPLGGTLAIIGGIAVAVTIGLMLFLMNGPESEVSDAKETFTLTGNFSFAAARDDGQRLPAGLAAENQPVFFKVADRLKVNYTYHSEGATLTPSESQPRLVAYVRADNGWKTEIPIEQSNGDAAPGLTGSVRLEDIRRTVQELEDSTSVVLSNFYVDVTATSRTTAAVRGTVATAVFAPTLTFRGDKTQLQLWEGGRDVGSSLHPTQTQTVLVPRVMARTASIGAVTIDSGQARALIGVAGLVFVAAAAALALHAAELRRRPLGERLLAITGRKLAYATSAPAGTNAVELDRMEDLVRIGGNSTVLSSTRNGEQSFFVSDGNTWYSHTPSQHNEGQELETRGWKTQRESKKLS